MINCWLSNFIDCCARPAIEAFCDRLTITLPHRTPSRPPAATPAAPPTFVAIDFETADYGRQ